MALHCGGWLAGVIRRRHRAGPKNGEDSEQGTRRSAMHDLDDFFPQPAGGKDPVIRLLVATLEGIDNVFPEVLTLVVQDGVRATGGELNRVE